MNQALMAILLSPPFTPAKLFRNGEGGVWLDPSDAATGYQDSAATTANVIDSPIGKRLDKSGRGNHVLQATADARPTWKLESAIYSDLCDGTNDGYATAVFSAGSLTSDMDCFVAVKRNAVGNFLLATSSAVDVNFFGNVGGTPTAGSGTPTAVVDGVAVAGGTGFTGAALSDALTVGVWHVLEFHNLDLSAWDQLKLSQYPGLYLNGQMGGLILAPAQSDAQRAKARRYLGRKVGLSL